jgi:hypothetical protein
MPTGQDLSPENIRAGLASAHAALFGERSDDALAVLLDSTAQSIAVISRHALGAYDAEPDFITGSSEKEPSA